MKRFLIIALANSLLCFSLFGQDFGMSLKDDANSLWRLTPDKFKTTFGSPEVYKWKSALKNVLVYNSKSSETKLLFFEQLISKANFRFQSKQLQGISLVLEKPDASSNKESYLENISNLKKQIGGLGKNGAPKERKRKSNGGYVYTCSWVSQKYYISLKSNYKGDSKETFKPGSIKFSIFRRFAVAIEYEKDKTATETASKIDTEADVKTDAKAADDSKIKTDEKGDRYLVVPMIEESSPRECVTVCVKRLFAYYKTAPRNRNWNKISKNLVLNVKSYKNLREIFGSIASECRCHVKKLAATSIFDDFNSINGFIRDYNAQASKIKKSTLSSSSANSFRKLIALMDEEVLVNARNNPKKIQEFKSIICQEIDAEKPVLWIAFLGVVKEDIRPISTGGGQARLIVGYNSKTNEVIYSDNWGKGHELKKMSWEKAWAITLSVLAITIK